MFDKVLFDQIVFDGSRAVSVKIEKSLGYKVVKEHILQKTLKYVCFEAVAINKTLGKSF